AADVAAAGGPRERPDSAGRSTIVSSERSLPQGERVERPAHSRARRIPQIQRILDWIVPSRRLEPATTGRFNANLGYSGAVGLEIVGTGSLTKQRGRAVPIGGRRGPSCPVRRSRGRRPRRPADVPLRRGGPRARRRGTGAE